MQAINHINSTAIPLPIQDVDTDQIIPARFLKEINKDNYADCLFADWRFKNNKPVQDFWLNREFKGNILVTTTNFGCGSSREHAAWALRDFGIQVIIAVSFADIFKNNALNNGIIPIELDHSLINQIIDNVTDQPELRIEVRLDEQTVTLPDMGKYQFEINPFKKKCILEGIDEIDFLVNMRPEIETFESTLK